MPLYLVILWTAVAGYLLGDFFSGLFHWWEDRYGNPDWPIIGKLVVAPNIEHHRHPTNTCRRTYWYRCGSSILATLPVIGLCVWQHYYVVAVALAVLSQANEVHSWAHQRMGSAIRALQGIGVLCSPRHHAVHHRRPYDQRYCVITGWLNPVLHAIHVWDALELIVYFTLRVKPNPSRLIW